MSFLRAEIDKGRQAYIIFPLIEESDKLDYENLMSGYEVVKGYFPEPKYWISMVHGRQPAEQKQQNMQRFVNGESNIMVINNSYRGGCECAECKCDGDRKRRKVWSFTIAPVKRKSRAWCGKKLLYPAYGIQFGK
jgi:hypothetical protein